MAIGDFYNLSADWRRPGGTKTCSNVFCYQQVTGLFLDTPAEDLVQAFVLSALEIYAGVVSNQIELFRYRVQALPSGLTLYTVEPTPVPGAQTGEMLPVRTAGVLTLRTAQPGRSGRGRKYFPPTNVGQNDDGRPGSGYKGFMVDVGNDLISIGDGVTTALWSLSVWSKKDNTGYEVTSVTSNPLWGSQRDRVL